MLEEALGGNVHNGYNIFINFLFKLVIAQNILATAFSGSL